MADKISCTVLALVFTSFSVVRGQARLQSINWAYMMHCSILYSLYCEVQLIKAAQLQKHVALPWTALRLRFYEGDLTVFLNKGHSFLSCIRHRRIEYITLCAFPDETESLSAWCHHTHYETAIYSSEKVLSHPQNSHEVKLRRALL